MTGPPPSHSRIDKIRVFRRQAGVINRHVEIGELVGVPFGVGAGDAADRATGTVELQQYGSSTRRPNVGGVFEWVVIQRPVRRSGKCCRHDCASARELRHAQR